MLAAAADLANVASALDEAHRSASPATLALSPAAADEVSEGIAQLFSRHAQDYQLVAREAATFQQQFIQNLTAGTSSYASAEVSSASWLQALDASANYYTTAGLALTSMIVTFPIAIAGLAVFPVFWPILLLAPFLFLVNLTTLINEVIAGAPISYPLGL
ncbi:hypothetical protein A5634_10940 [Mycobacterium asiaticum]|uniref:PE domain-containing protein n=2 Tax=Mycobacterium asiaticum TaxID=1790 RepID=A0A1A3NIV1_MYCAS|nr:hypothetical protein A5634_10940 [Mycobacterium asiaticum]